MMDILQQTASGFVRSSSRRLDVELCLMNLCEPGLQTDAQSLNARLSRLEEQLRTGNFAAPVQSAVQAAPQNPAGELPPPADDAQAPAAADVPEQNGETVQPAKDDTPIGFWADLSAQMRQALPKTVAGFFYASENAPVHGRVRENRLGLICSNAFVAQMIDRPEVKELAARKASAMLGRPMQVVIVDRTAKQEKSKQMEQLLAFGRQHNDIVKIKNSDDQ
jgi:DNA polymerase-3 subunit gamma/tau